MIDYGRGKSFRLKIAQLDLLDFHLPHHAEEWQQRFLGILGKQVGFLGELVTDEAIGRAGVEDEPIRAFAVDLDADDHVLRLDQFERHDDFLGRLLFRAILGKCRGRNEESGDTEY